MPISSVDLLGVAATADAGRGEQRRDAGASLGVKRDVALGVGLRLLDELGGLLGGHRERDGVAVGLAHLAAVKAGQERRRGEKPCNLGKDLAVALVEATGDLRGDLDVGELVASHGHDVALAEEDVACLVHGVGEEQSRERVAGGRLLCLHGGVALHLGLRSPARGTAA